MCEHHHSVNEVANVWSRKYGNGLYNKHHGISLRTKAIIQNAHNAIEIVIKKVLDKNLKAHIVIHKIYQYKFISGNFTTDDIFDMHKQQEKHLMWKDELTWSA